MYKIFSTKTCLHPLAGSTCHGSIVRAHTVRRSADLKKIARNGHVYSGQVNPKTIRVTEGCIIPHLVGINEASTFWGFCEAHDRNTFAPLETCKLIPTDEQAFLLCYRPLARELYFKQRQYESLDLCSAADKGRPLHQQYGLQHTIHSLKLGVQKAIKDLKHHKKSFDDDLLSANHSRIRYIVLHLEEQPEFMCSGIAQPIHSFNGRQLQDLNDLNTTLDFISFSLISTETGGAAVFAWLSDSDRSCNMLLNSFLELDSSAMPHAILRFAFTSFENIFISPDWWESLASNTRKAIEERVNCGASPLDTVPANCLIDDGIRAVNWQIVNVFDSRKQLEGRATKQQEPCEKAKQFRYRYDEQLTGAR